MSARVDSEPRNMALRKFYRQNQAEGAGPGLRAEFARLYGRAAERGEIERIVCSAFIEARELVGWRVDPESRNWVRADGSVVTRDDGREWRHV